MLRHGPSCQPLHVQYSSDGSRSLTTLTTPRGEHHCGGRRRGLGRGRRGAEEDAAVEARAERSTRVHQFGCAVRLPLPHLPRLRVIPFLGLSIVHRRGALRVAWSTWSRNDFHRNSTVRGEADSWIHGHSPFFCDLPSKSLCQACWAANL